MATLYTDAPPRSLSWPMQVAVALTVAAALSAAACWWVDRPVWALVHEHGVDRFRVLKWLTRPPEAFVLASPVVLVAGLFVRWFRPWGRVERVAVAAAVSTLLTALAAGVLKFTFGRAVDGFHPFHYGAAYWFFPSGHTACTVSVTEVLGAAFPKSRAWGWALAAVVAASLVALNYHYVADIVGGAFTGWVVAGTAARWFGLGDRGEGRAQVVRRGGRAGLTGGRPWSG